MSDFISKSRLKWEIEKWYEKEYYSSFNAAVYKVLLNIIDKFPSADQEKCGDCVSRQAAIEAEKEMCKYYTPTKSVDHPHIDFVIEELQKLPSVEPERKPGKWEYVQYDGNPKIGNWHCSNCRLIVNLGFEGAPYYHYCPGCGADMRSEQSLKYADNDTALGGLQSAT